MVAENTPFVILQEKMLRLQASREKLFVAVSQQCDPRALSIIGEFLVNYDNEIKAYTLSLGKSQLIPQDMTLLASAFSQLSKLNDLRKSSSLLSRAPALESELLKMMSEMTAISRFIVQCAELGL